ncbi:MAG: phosphoenolpyruvate carboxykinase (ATP), partial [Candidatus Lernaella stagnicola]|nr:phosphoenolpyruvate carboxykinase (ATP) [Candidatus Lernaella stagnicola]
RRIAKHKVDCWLINTGWTGGPFGTGHRIPIQHTRAMIHAALEGKLDDATFTPDPVFGVLVPENVPGVPSDVLQPRNTWKDKRAYDRQARKLAQLFADNFTQFADEARDAVNAAAPRVK